MRPIHITAVGLDEWELNFLQATIGIASGTDIAEWTYVGDPQQASVVLLGAAAPDEPFRERRTGGEGDPSAPIVVHVVERAARPATGFERTLARPIVYTELVALLRSLEPKQQRPDAVPVPLARAASAAGAVAAPDPRAAVVIEATPAPAPAPVATLPLVVEAPRSAPASAAAPLPAADAEAGPADAPESIQARLARRARRGLRFFDGTRLLGLVRRALEGAQVVEILHPRFPSVTIYPTLQAFACAADPASLPAMFRVPAMEFTSRDPETGTSGVRPRLPRPARQPLARLMYCAAYFGAEGRLPAVGAVDDRFELIAAPDFRVIPFSDATQAIVLRLANVLAELEDIAIQTRVPLETVIDTLGAFEAIGVVRRHPGGGAVDGLATLSDSAIRRTMVGAVDRLRTFARSILPGDGVP